MILLTGFEPFDGESVNPSWLAVQQAAELLRAAGHAVRAVELPCVFGLAAAAIRRAVDEANPELVLAVGQAGDRSRLSLERVAINVDDARIPDNSGAQPIDEPVRSDGPAAYFSTLPIKSCLEQLTAAGVRAEVSQTAGTFVCNHVFYALMDHLATRAQPAGMAEVVRGGFIHLPYATEQVRTQDVPSMDVAVMAQGLAVAALTALDTRSDAKIGAGALH
ncbi:pyroglutamyl-peptidase I [Paenarthrobacter sp. Z7-10]|uniref:pyroglutamyl-peptidase I n=1 Tax=Paenarthrobacter sp. Z7-10 TaxID=2787635 RepID=UPI0022A9CDE4|nr:pyroglutamyl-peptidase I [Paenarthrobacter sp. Z7-10]MCZ2403740.1 pyroglutamyl-peptidase I [Paenarthrobacter sp. Z7-10]